MVSDVRGRLCTALVPDDGFSFGFEDGLTAADSVPHAVIHVIPRRAGDQVALPACSEWAHDDGFLP
jgi:diadenosine tetraphosphate (Ap4A) HIT family hydrolase